MVTTNDSKTKLAMVLALVASLTGCPTDPVPATDAGRDAGGTTDAPVTPDAPPVADVGPLADVPVLDAPAGCDADEISVRDVCVAACGASADDLDAALADALVPVAHYCRSPLAWGAVGDHVYDVTMREEGTMTFHFDLSRWTATPGTAPEPTVVATATYTGLDADEMVFTGGYVAVAPDEMHVVFGFTTSRSGFFGGVFDVATAGGAVLSTDAPGNFDATFVSNGRVIVNGTGLAAAAGQGLYELTAGMMGGDLVADGMGDASGSIAYWEAQDLVVAGGASYGSPFPTGETSRVFFVDPADLDVATHADLSSGDFLALPSAFAWIPGDQMVETVYQSVAPFGIDHLAVRSLAIVGGAPEASEPTSLTNDGTFYSAHGLDGDIGLQHGTGILVVRQVD